jgi:hypothetical protein
VTRIPVILSLVVLLLAPGCGGDDEPAKKEPKPPAEPALKPGEVPPGNVARVTDTLISKERYDHWAAASKKQDPPCRGRTCLAQTMEFLISAEWLGQEATMQGISVTDAEIDKEFERQRKESFPRAEDYEKFLRESGQTEADLRYRIKLSLISDKLQKRAGEGVSGKDRQKALDRFVKEYQQRYKAKTICAPGYKVEQCGSVAPG